MTNDKITQQSAEPRSDVVAYVARWGGHCRDCADENGVCPNSGLPCGGARKAIEHVLRALRYGVQHGYIDNPLQPPAQPAAERKRREYPPELKAEAERSMDALIAQHMQAQIPAQQSAWVRAVDDAMVVSHLGVADEADDYETAKRKLNALLSHEQSVGAYFAEVSERERWESALSAVMPADFKDWHQNSPAERPEVAAWVITNLRQRLDEAEAIAAAQPADEPLLRQALEALEKVSPHADKLTDYSSTAAEWPLNLLPREVDAAIAALRKRLENKQ